MGGRRGRAVPGKRIHSEFTNETWRLRTPIGTQRASPLLASCPSAPRPSLSAPTDLPCGHPYPLQTPASSQVLGHAAHSGQAAARAEAADSPERRRREQPSEGAEPAACPSSGPAPSRPGPGGEGPRGHVSGGESPRERRGLPGRPLPLPGINLGDRKYNKTSPC